VRPPLSLEKIHWDEERDTFDSRARGQATPESDYDFLVVIPESNEPRYRRDQEAYLDLCGSGAAKDIIVLTRAEFESSRRAEAAAWLAKARIDLRAARADLNASPPITSDALFHCQQAVEKALKGFLAAKEKPLQVSSGIPVNRRSLI
jgi:predicted nucleotidyltransferase